MSNLMLKTRYKENEEHGGWASTIYAHHNLGVDVVSFYDKDGKFLFAVNDNIEDGMIEAINRLYYEPYGENIENMSLEDREKCGI